MGTRTFATASEGPREPDEPSAGEAVPLIDRLPFTGMDTLALALIGIGLLGGGAALMVFGRPERQLA